MKLMVCGSIGYGGADTIKEFYHKLKQQGFEILNHIEEKGMDYSNVQDFRNRKKLTKKIVEHDLRYIRKADVIIVLSSKASYGTAIEMYVAKKLGKKVIFFVPNPIPTPWPIYFSDFIVKNEKELYHVLRNLK